MGKEPVLIDSAQWVAMVIINTVSRKAAKARMWCLKVSSPRKLGSPQRDEKLALREAWRASELCEGYLFIIERIAPLRLCVRQSVIALPYKLIQCSGGITLQTQITQSPNQQMNSGKVRWTVAGLAT